MEPAKEYMSKFDHDEIQQSINEWVVWKNSANRKVKFEFGTPLQIIARITKDGVIDSDNKASGYSIIEADSKDAVIDVLLNHPHLNRDGATLDILEMIPMS